MWYAIPNFDERFDADAPSATGDAGRGDISQQFWDSDSILIAFLFCKKAGMRNRLAAKFSASCDTVQFLLVDFAISSLGMG